MYLHMPDILRNKMEESYRNMARVAPTLHGYFDKGHIPVSTMYPHFDSRKFELDKISNY